MRKLNELIYTSYYVDTTLTVKITDNYTKKNALPAIGGIITIIDGNNNRWTGVCYASPDPDAVVVVQDYWHVDITAYSTPVIDNGNTWYFTRNYYFMGGTPTIPSTLPYLGEISSADYNAGKAVIRMLDSVSWYLDGENFLNYNFIDLPSSAMLQPYPYALWRIEEGYNDGIPYNMLLPDIQNVQMWVQPSEPVIHVYSSQDNEFTTNGYAILEPISCEIHHEENGVYEATLETYCDEFNKFTYVKKQAQIRIPLKYHGETKHQIFRIRECTRRMDEQGNYRIVATAQHKFYDLTRYMIEDCRPTSLNGENALNWIFTHGWYGEETDEEFTYSSNITNSRTAYFQNMNVVNALLGADQCFVNRWGGKLYRDNTYFSLNTSMENAHDAGVICYGYNMTEIELVEDDSELITILEAEDNYGNKYEIVNENVPSEAIPHHIYGYAKFTYDVEDVDAFHADAQAYFDEHKQSSLNLTVRFANLSDIDLYKEFLALDDFEVGDHITVYHKDLDIFYANLEIISKTYDVVAQKTSEIQIGSLRSAITSRPFLSQTVSSGNSVEDKQYISLDDQLDEVAFFALVQYPISTEDDELLVTSDGKYIQYRP